MSISRRIFILVLVIGSALNISFPLSAQDADDAEPLAPNAVNGETYYAPFPVAITLDGALDDWAGVPWVDLSKFMGNASVQFAAAADADFLYFAADVTDRSIIAGQHGSDFWNEDSVELYLNATGDLTLKSYGDGVAQLTLPAVNIGVDPAEAVVAGMRGDTINATSIMVATDHGYVVEVAVPLVNDVWNIVPAHEGVLGFNVHLNAAAATNRDTKLIWSLADPADTSYQNPSVFGQLSFFEVGTEVTIVAEATPENLTPLDPSITWDSRAWELVWSDEFEGEAGTPFNSENWNPETNIHVNNELQQYTTSPDNISLDGEGNLAIVARRDESGGYTSGRLITNGKYEFTYGRIEARLKIPYGQGIWPAFWMLGDNINSAGWPASGEIDIMENIGKEPKIVHGTVHGPGYSGASGIGGPITLEENFSDEFHVFAVDWDPDAIRWYMDGTLYFALTPGDLGTRRWVFDHDFFIILNLAVGGDWPGNPDETTEFPQTYLVDYVRVYKLAETQP